MKRDKGAWSVVDVPKALKPWVKIPDCCEADGILAIPPDDQHDETVGWLVALADSPKELIETIKDEVALLPDGVSARTESLVELIQEAEKMEQDGIPITEKPLPEPAAVVENT